MDLVTPEDPQSNGFAEVFVKILCKLLHTAAAEGRDPREELHKYLMHYRATPHPTTGKSPAEMLNNRKIRTKLPQFFAKTESSEMANIRRNHDEKKLIQKQYFDRRRNATEKAVNPGDKILVKQNKSTTKSPYDPKPYKVVQVEGNQVDAVRDNKFRRRDKNSIKVVKPRPEHLIPSWERHAQDKGTYSEYGDFEIEGRWTAAEPVNHQSAELVSIPIDEPIYIVRENGCDGPVDLLSSSFSSDTTSNGGQMGVTQGNEVGKNGENGAKLSGASIGSANGLGLVGSKERCDVTQVFPSALSSMSQPQESRHLDNRHSQLTLRKGDLVAFKGKGTGREWFTATLLSRAGRAKGKYSMAWNILQDEYEENIDFERDCSSYKVVEDFPSAEFKESKLWQNTVPDGQNGKTSSSEDSDMSAHNAFLLDAAIQREVVPPKGMNAHLESLFQAAIQREAQDVPEMQEPETAELEPVFSDEDEEN